MDFLSELIGFLIVLFVLLFPLFRRLIIGKQKPQRPPPTEFEEEEAAPPPPPRVEKRAPRPVTARTVSRDFDFHTELEERALESKVTKRHLKMQAKPEFKETVVSTAYFPLMPRAGRRRHGPSLLDGYLKKGSLEAMIVLSEVLGKPKSLRQENEY